MGVVEWKKEAIAIRKIKPSLNKDGGRYHLSAIYDDVIQSRLDIKTPGQGEKTPQNEKKFDMLPFEAP